MEPQPPCGALDPRIKWLQDNSLSIILRVFEPQDTLWNVTDVLNLQRADCNELLGDVQGLIVYNRIQAAKNNMNSHSNRSNGSSFYPVVGQISPKLDASPPTTFHTSPLQQQHHLLQHQNPNPATTANKLSPTSLLDGSPIVTIQQQQQQQQQQQPPPPYQILPPFTPSFSGLVGGLPSLSNPERSPPRDVQAALMASVEANDVVDVASILTTFPGLVNCEAEDGQSPLFCAKSAEMLRLLIDRGADVNHRSKDGDTPVYLYADPELVSVLHSAGADINTKNMLGETPLGNAIEVKDLDLIHTLLSLRANPALIAKQPLDFASLHCPEALSLLISSLDSFSMSSSASSSSSTSSSPSASSCSSSPSSSCPRSLPSVSSSPHLLNQSAFANTGDNSWRGAVEPKAERARVLSEADYPALGTLPPPKKKHEDEPNPWIEVKRERQLPVGSPSQQHRGSLSGGGVHSAAIALCPFNSGHRMAPASLARHKFTCSDRPKSRGGNGSEHGGGQVVGEMVTCSFNQGHCVPRATLSVHERRCPDNPQATLVQCPHTSDHRHRFAAEDMPAHAEKCRARPVMCPYDARHKMPFQALQKHKEVCPARPM